MYESSKKRFPGSNNDMNGVDVSWQVTVLAYLDQQGLASDWSANTYKGLAGPTPPLDMFLCPTRPFVDRNLPQNSFVANRGFIARSSDPSPLNGGAIKAPPTGGYDYWDSRRLENGLFVDRYVPKTWTNKPPKNDLDVTLTDLYDGLTYTVVITENLQAGTWDQPGPCTTVGWIYAAEPGNTVDVSVITNTVLPPETPVPAVARINGVDSTVSPPEPAPCSWQASRPSSRHSSGINACFADGSTKFISADIEYAVYQSLLTVRDRKSDMPNRTRGLLYADF